MLGRPAHEDDPAQPSPARPSLYSTGLRFLLLLQCRMLEETVASKPFQSDRLYADVIVPRHLPGPFTYLVPTELISVLNNGQ